MRCIRCVCVSETNVISRSWIRVFFKKPPCLEPFVPWGADGFCALSSGVWIRSCAFVCWLLHWSPSELTSLRSLGLILQCWLCAQERGCVHMQCTVLSGGHAGAHECPGAASGQATARRKQLRAVSEAAEGRAPSGTSPAQRQAWGGSVRAQGTAAAGRLFPWPRWCAGMHTAGFKCV